MASAEVRTVGDRYVLDRVVARSPGTDVWLAHDDVVGRPVIVKLYAGPSSGDPAWQQAFRDRAGQLVALSHPGIASTYDYGDSHDDAWLATELVRDAVALAELPPTSVAGALDLVGRTAIALDASHKAGVAHGAMAAEHVLVRPDGTVALTGFAMSQRATVADDLDALRALALDLLRAPAQAGEPLGDAAGFVAALAGAAGRTPPADAGDLGRTALELAAAKAGGPPVDVPAAAQQPERSDAEVAAASRMNAERTRVRNKLMALGAIVVVFGAALLWFIGRGGSDGTVPNVVDLPVPQAQSELIQDGFRGVASDSTGTVSSQSPQAGSQLKRGSTVTLTVSGGGGG
jgi:serine/threonine protein kinase